MSAQLAVPARRGPKLDAACATAARGVILDLEDGIPESDKAAARAELAACVDQIRASGKLACVRINPIATQFWRDDLDAVVGARPDQLMVAKMEDGDEVRTLDAAVVERGLDGMRYIVLVESAAALDRLEEIAGASHRVDHIGIGLGDMCRSHGMTWEVAMTTQRPLVHEWRARLALISHRCEIGAPWDTVWLRLGDLEGLRRDALLGRLLGFAGKTAVDPAQVPIVNEVYQDA